MRRQLADWLGIRRTDVVELEAGSRTIRSDELAKLVVLHGRSISWLVGHEPALRDLLAASVFHAAERLINGEDAH